MASNPIKLGAAFPNVDLQTTKGDIKLADWMCADPEKPWTIFFSHPADFTPVCTTELGMCHNLSADFAAMGAKLIGVSCDSVESHQAWSKDVVAKAGKPDDDLAFPIIADPDRSLVSFFGMIDPEEKEAGGTPMPARALIILYGNVVKLTLLYPATTGRDFNEIKRVLKSLQLTQNNGLATPANWEPCCDVVVTPGFEGKNDGKDPSTVEGYQVVALPSGKQYLRLVPGAFAAALPKPGAAPTAVVDGATAGPNPLKLGATFPNDDYATTGGDIKLGDWISGDAEWTIFFSHPADFTPVCTTELGMCHNMAGDFAAMGAKLIGVSCDSVESHQAWSKDVVAKAGKPDDALAFPIIADPDRKLVTMLGMIDPEEKEAGGPPMPARALAILHKNVVKLSIVYPATTGRNFDEIKRVLQSLQLTQNNGLATPANWVCGDSVVVTPGFEGKNDGKDPSTIPGYEVVALPSGKPYLRMIPHP